MVMAQATVTAVAMVPETAETVAVQVTAAKAAVQVVAAVRVIPVVTNLAAAAKAVPQSHQRNSLL